MQTRSIKSLLSALATATVVVALALAAGNAMAVSSSAKSRIGITKLASLHVASMENSELVSNDSMQQMESATCMQSAGADMPYRISASSLSNNNQFSVQANNSTIPYQVSWSNDNNNTWVLDSANDQTGVLSATSAEKCAMNTISVQLNNNAFNSAGEGIYTDTLSLMLVIE